MKKTKYYAWMMAAALAMTGCSDEIDTGGENGGTTTTEMDGYIKISLNLPTTSDLGTRAENEANDQFHNGIGDEYTVGDDNFIVFFEGTDESAASYLSISSLTGLDFDNANTDPSNITTTSTVVMGAPKRKNESNNLYALVILNANGTVSSSDGKLSIGGQEKTTPKLSDFKTALSGDTYGKVSTYTTANNKPSFTMLNAPIAKLSATDQNFSTNENVTTLAEVEVYGSKEDAASATPDPIYVERVVAKVTIAGFPTALDPTDENSPLKDASITLTAWKVGNTNKSTKLLRDVGTSTSGWGEWKSIANTSTTNTTNRFFGTSATPFRVYWAIDKNYTSTADGDLDMNPVAGSIKEDNGTVTWNTKWKDGDNFVPEYCLENTFDNSDGSVPGNIATRVVFQVQVTPDIKEDGTKVENDDDPKATDFILGKERSTLYTKTTFLAEVKDYTGINDLQLAESLTAHTYTTKDDLKNMFQSNTLLTDEVAQKILDHFGGMVQYYQNNFMYYSATYIKHFGEHYTPLKADGALSGKESYLGRYGVVRNNWYELNITSVGIGSPTVPGDDDNIDASEAFLNGEINILSWAARKQNVDL